MGGRNFMAGVVAALLVSGAAGLHQARATEVHCCACRIDDGRDPPAWTVHSPVTSLLPPFQPSCKVQKCVPVKLELEGHCADAKFDDIMGKFASDPSPDAATSMYTEATKLAEGSVAAAEKARGAAKGVPAAEPPGGTPHCCACLLGGKWEVQGPHPTLLHQTRSCGAKNCLPVLRAECSGDNIFPSESVLTPATKELMRRVQEDGRRKEEEEKERKRRKQERDAAASKGEALCGPSFSLSLCGEEVPELTAAFIKGSAANSTTDEDESLKRSPLCINARCKSMLFDGGVAPKCLDDFEKECQPAVKNIFTGRSPSASEGWTQVPAVRNLMASMVQNLPRACTAGPAYTVGEFGATPFKPFPEQYGEFKSAVSELAPENSELGAFSTLEAAVDGDTWKWQCKRPPT